MNISKNDMIGMSSEDLDIRNDILYCIFNRVQVEEIKKWMVRIRWLSMSHKK